MIVKRICICFFAFFTAIFLIFGSFSLPSHNPNSYSSFSAYKQTKTIYPNLDSVSDLVSSLSDTFKEFSLEEMIRDYNNPIQTQRPILNLALNELLDCFKPFIFIGRFAINIYNVIEDIIVSFQTYRLTV